MERAAMVLYLRNVRDLEVARNKLDLMIGHESNQAKREITPLKQEVARLRAIKQTPYVKYPKEPQRTNHTQNYVLLIGGMILLVIPLVWAVNMILAWSNLFLIFFAFLVVWGCISAEVKLLGLLGGLNDTRSKEEKEYKEYLAECEKIKEQNARIEAQNQVELAGASDREQQAQAIERDQIAPIMRRHDANISYLKTERNKVTGILNDMYDMNVLASQYRSLSRLCYIYDYMSTSQATLEDALMHEHMENGFQRIEKQLGRVVKAIEVQIYETRCLRGDIQSLSAQIGEAKAEQAMRDRRMLGTLEEGVKSLQATERNSLAAAQYAEVIESNTRATAYFELANYFKD